MNILNKKFLFRFLAIMLMVTTYLPIVSNNLPPIFRSHHIWTPIWFFCLLFLAPRTFKNKVFLYTIIAGSLFVFIYLDIIWPYTTEWNSNLALIELYAFTIGLSLYAYFWTYNDFKGVAIIVKWTLIFIGITAIMTIISAQIDPLYARNITGDVYTRDDDIFKYGGGTYGFAAALIILVPSQIYFLKFNKEIRINKTLIIGYLLLCLVSLVSLQFFANILLGIALFAISVVSAHKMKSTAFILIIIIAIGSIIPTEYYLNFIYYISDFFQRDSNIHSKLSDLALLIQAPFLDESNAFLHRGQRYPLLIDAFANNPIFGFFSENNAADIAEGGHIYWMNKLAVYGLFAFIPFTLIFVLYVQSVSKKIDDRFKVYFYLAIAGFITLGLMKALSGREFWYMVFFILPGTFVFFNYRVSHFE